MASSRGDSLGLGIEMHSRLGISYGRLEEPIYWYFGELLDITTPSPGSFMPNTAFL
jgi:hypothetical protein